MKHIIEVTIDLLPSVMLYVLAMGILNAFVIGSLVEPNKTILYSELSLLVFCALLAVVSIIRRIRCTK